MTKEQKEYMKSLEMYAVACGITLDRLFYILEKETKKLKEILIFSMDRKDHKVWCNRKNPTSGNFSCDCGYTEINSLARKREP